jgi:mycothiol synthase
MADPVVEIELLERLDQDTADAIESLVERSAVHERHSPIGEHQFVRLQLGDDDTFGLVARRDGRLAGYAHATRFPAHGRLPSRLAAELLVDPELRGRGVGRALLDRLLEEARADGLDRLDAWAHHADAAAVGLAEALGMRVTRQLWQMALRLDDVLPRRRRVPIPDDLALRTFRRGEDDELLVALIRSAFPDHPENAGFEIDDLEASARLPWFDPSAILLAFDRESGEALGVHWMKLDSDGEQGEVYLLGVIPAAQGRGAGRILLLEGLEEMRRRAIRLAYLYVDAENEPAVALYRQAGFRHQHLDTCYSLDLDGEQQAR